MTGERPGTSDLGQNYRNYSRTIFVPGLVRIHNIQHQFQDPDHVAHQPLHEAGGVREQVEGLDYHWGRRTQYHEMLA